MYLLPHLLSVPIAIGGIYSRVLKHLCNHSDTKLVYEVVFTGGYMLASICGGGGPIEPLGEANL